ncbi:MAG: diguanylate cyclase, partial [Candidatus Omnitrophota bacterium]
MEKVLYCVDKSIKKKLSLPFSFDKASSLKDISKSAHHLIVIEEGLLKRKNIAFPILRNKIYFIHFTKKNKNSLGIAKKFGFFDYISNEDSKADIALKLQRASNFLDLNAQIDNLGCQILIKDKKIEKIALTDPLTGCYNWRYFLHRVHAELERSKKHAYNISFIGVDVDQFRRVNEVYGVKVADTIAKKLVNVLNSCLSAEDVLTRWRGDEFFIISPHTARAEVQEKANKIKRKITAHKFKYKDLSLNIKVSVAVVSSPEDHISNTRDIVSALGGCLAQSKRKGGDSIVFYSSAKINPLPEREKRASVKELRGKIEGLNGLLTRDLIEMIYGFARAIEAKDSYTGKHVEYTALVAEEIAKSLRLPKDEVLSIKHAAVLHDLGKVGIEEKILSKKGPLNAKEWEAMKSHPSIAAEILKEIHALRGA